MAEINVVPYIDVMLVLLVIFMVTAPLITQGVKVDLPQAEAQPQPGEGSPPVVIHIDQFGDTYVDLGDNDLLPVDQQLLYERCARCSTAPATPVMVRADASGRLRSGGRCDGRGAGRRCAERRAGDAAARGARR
jgi:biopolymer transport protein TolR